MTACITAPDQPPALAPFDAASLQGIPLGPYTFAGAREAIAAEADIVFGVAESADLAIPENAWLSRDALRTCRNHAGSARFVDSDGRLVCIKGEPTAAPTVELAAAVCVHYPWQLLDVMAMAAADLPAAPPFPAGTIRDGATIDGTLWCGEGSVILPGVFAEGPVFIGNNCKIGPNCYLRGPLFIGDNCRIGQSVEIKACLIMHKTNVGHLSYVGDSVLGSGVNFGAGTTTANLRHDGKSVATLVDGTLVDSGRRKFGAIVGDGTHTGIHTAIYPGRKFAAHAATRPAAVVDRDVSAQT